MTNEHKTIIKDRIVKVEKWLNELSSNLSQVQLEPGWRKEVKNVIFLASSSRGGSSATSELLKHSSSLLHFQGEINPALAAVGLTPPFTESNSDELTNDDFNKAEIDGRIDLVEKILSVDIGYPLPRFTCQEAIKNYSVQLLFRLRLQWPNECFDTKWIMEQSLIALKETKVLNSEISERLIIKAFRHFLHKIRDRHPCVQPAYYDLNHFNNHGIIKHHLPPSNTILEETPFIVIRPFKVVNEDLYNKPLLIKTPSNNYRLEFWKRFFPNACHKIIHLTRHPGASINGLIDGWKYHGFHYALLDNLSISGYTDEIPFGDLWWKFDLPPGWQEKRNDNLLSVASFQWTSAHNALLNQHGYDGKSYFALKFEDLFNHRHASIKHLSTLSQWIFNDQRLCLLTHCVIPPVMSTNPPNHDRWKKKYDEIIPYISEEESRYISNILGYKI